MHNTRAILALTAVKQFSTFLDPGSILYLYPFLLFPLYSVGCVKRYFRPKMKLKLVLLQIAASYQDSHSLRGIVSLSHDFVIHVTLILSLHSFFRANSCEDRSYLSGYRIISAWLGIIPLARRIDCAWVTCSYASFIKKGDAPAESNLEFVLCWDIPKDYRLYVCIERRLDHHTGCIVSLSTAMNCIWIWLIGYN